MNASDIERRLTAIEHALASMKAERTPAGKPHPIQALEQIHGTFEDDEAFREATRLGRRCGAKGRALGPEDGGEAQVIYILDTDVITIAELPDSPEYLRLHARVLGMASEDVLATTIVTYEEQTRGWLAYAAKSRLTTHQVKAYARLKKHLTTYAGFTVLDFDETAGREFDRLRGLKLHVGTADLKIAAIAISQNAILLSRNLRHFKKIPDVAVEGWTQP